MIQLTERSELNNRFHDILFFILLLNKRNKNEEDNSLRPSEGLKKVPYLIQ